MVCSGLTRITPERPGEIRPFHQRDDAADEFSDVTWRAKDRAFLRDGRACGSLIWRQRRRQYLSDLFEIARDDPAAERHVFEHLGR